MSRPNDWLERFEKALNDLKNPFVYWVAMPMLIVGIVSMLSSLPVPDEFARISPLLNWGSAFLMAAAVYYFIISLSLALGLMPVLLGIAVIPAIVANRGYPLRGVATALLIAGVVGLLLGRAGRVSQVLRDLQLIMIGPAWLLSRMYRRFGIPV